MLRFEEVHFRYPGATQSSLEAVTLDVPAGSAFGLLGPNGAGKTTLLHLAAGLLPMQKGRVLMGGELLDAARRARPRALALVPQDIACYPQLTVRENLRFFGEVQNLGGSALRAREEAVVDFARLETIVDRLAGELSGGMKRRLNLAIGLLADPEVLLLDEPTVGVDPQSRHFLLESIRALARQGRTVLYTSHYMDEIEALCDHVAILDHGQVLLAGTLAEVLAATPSVLSLRFAVPLSAQLRAKLEGRFPGMEALLGDRYRLSGLEADAVPHLLAELAAEGASVAAWSWGQQHLDEVFLDLTHRALRDA